MKLITGLLALFITVTSVTFGFIMNHRCESLEDKIKYHEDIPNYTKDELLK